MVQRPTDPCQETRATASGRQRKRRYANLTTLHIQAREIIGARKHLPPALLHAILAHNNQAENHP